MQFRLYREFFRAISNPTRFAIVQLLRERPHYVGELVEELGFEQSRVSHNLGCLLNCGFVVSEWNGKNKVYSLNPEILPVLIGIEKHLTRYAPSLDSCQTLEAEKQPLVIIAKPAPTGRTSNRPRRNSIGVKK